MYSTGLEPRTLTCNRPKQLVSGWYYRKIHYLTRKFHIEFLVRNRYRTNRETMSSISVFQMNLTWNSRDRLWIFLESPDLLFTWRKPRFTYACVNVREMFFSLEKSHWLVFLFLASWTMTMVLKTWLKGYVSNFVELLFHCRSNTISRKSIAFKSRTCRTWRDSVHPGRDTVSAL